MDALEEIVCTATLATCTHHTQIQDAQQLLQTFPSTMTRSNSFSRKFLSHLLPASPEGFDGARKQPGQLIQAQLFVPFLGLYCLKRVPPILFCGSHRIAFRMQSLWWPYPWHECGRRRRLPLAASDPRPQSCVSASLQSLQPRLVSQHPQPLLTCKTRQWVLWAHMSLESWNPQWPSTRIFWHVATLPGWSLLPSPCHSQV